MASSELKELAKVCTEIARQASDSEGFVPIHRLATAFRAEVEFRPLLVEGVIAAPKSRRDGGVESIPWKVLIDSETHRVTPNAFVGENAHAPLSHRLRNTIAHELAHSLSFRAGEFGYRLEKKKGGRETHDEFVARIERETEKLSPLLLIPDLSLETEFSNTEATLQKVCAARERWAVSREVFVSRLNLLFQWPETNPLQYSRGLRNVGLLVGEWIAPDRATLLEWPTFAHFDNGIVPEFLIGLRGRAKPNLTELLPWPNFGLNGGRENEIQGDVTAGTSANPRGEKLAVTISMEGASRERGERFFMLVRASQRATA
jgi:hypothetical protein